MKNQKIKQLVTVSLLIAMIIVLQFIGSSIPPLFGTFSISLVLIPIVIGAAMYSPMTGAILGAAFGVVTAINCATGADPGGQMVFQANPVICVLVVMLKGILCGLSSGLVYKLFSRSNGYISMLLASIICPVVNTGTFLVCMLIFFKDVLAAWANGTDLFVYLISAIVLCNFVPELIINIVFSPAGQRIIKVVNNK